MKKTLKVIGVLLGILVILLVIAAVIATLTFNPNRYKGEITRLVEKQTGRTLTIGGKISLSFFPWIGAEVNTVSLSNAPGFGSGPFAQVARVGIKVKLLPLLRRKVEVDQIIIDGLKLKLIKDRYGRGDWQGLAGQSKPTAAATPGKTATPPVAGLFVGGINVQNSEVVWDNEQKGQRYTVRNLDFQTGQLGSGKLTDVSLGFDLDSGSPPLKTRVTLKARLAIDLGKQTLDVPHATLEAAGVKVRLTKLQGTRILAKPAFKGNLEIPSFNPRRLLDRLGIRYQPNDPHALTKVAFDGPFSVSATGVALRGFRLSLDTSTLNGSFELSDFSHPAYRFDLNLDKIDLDNYLPRSSAPAPKAQPAPTTRATVVLPLAALRALDINGIVKVQKLTATNIHTSNVRASILANHGVIVLNPLQAQLYGGSYRGSVKIDARGRIPYFFMNEQLQAVQVGPLLKDMQVFSHFTGTGNLAFNLDAHGLTPQQITSNLNGNGSFALRNGSIKGVDLITMINRTRAIAEQLRGKPVGAQLSHGGTTVFNSLTGTVHITNGVAHNNDLVLNSPTLAATGSGSANLVAQNMDYTLRVTMDRDNPSKRVTVPVTIRGPFKALTYHVDWSDIIKRQAEKTIKQQLRKQLDQGLRRLLQ